MGFIKNWRVKGTAEIEKSFVSTFDRTDRPAENISEIPF